MNIESLFKNSGFLEVSCADLSSSLSFDIYKAQIGDDNYGEISFLKDHLKFKDPNEKNKFKTAIIALYPYYPNNDELSSSLRVAEYAKSKDYHFVLKQKLDTIIFKLKEEYPNETFESATDSKPYLERDLAYRAGLGWIGKNTCLLNKEHGSLFFIAEILTSLNLKKLEKLDKKNELKTDHCGTCTKCIDVCPTEALTPRKMIVEKCISYRNIESKSFLIDELTNKNESWFFGCDLCQTVCPWNEKAHGKQIMETLTTKPDTSELHINELKKILESSNNSLEKKYQFFPFSRARGKRLKRNALFIIYENRLSNLIPFLESVSFKDELEKLRIEVINFLKNSQ